MHGFGIWMATSLFGYDKVKSKCGRIPLSANYYNIRMTSNFYSEGEHIL